MAARPVTVWALVLAGGTGSRFGSEQPKQLLDLGGRSVFARSVDALAGHRRVDRIVLVTHAASAPEAERIAAAEPKVVSVVAGGDTRAASTRAGLAAVPAWGDDDLVLVHDAARPLVPPAVIDACVSALDNNDAATPALECVDTVVEVDADRMVRTIQRARLRRVQTPQAFRASVLCRAHAADALAPGEPTDDCAVVLAHEPGARVVVVPGDERNLKITRPGDLAQARRWLTDS
ncbi:MAG: 2-C-methyl-D-erythritol 4-phosphate cytidylyltransferase [Aeromicrobium sp.]|uniref:2-C-methyl-D-erythritol 4-phosphate cytidylyltransferase n=1 Tax=Aeromicrobium sp. TaxID=1871063 RepID=UPI0039E31FCB